MSRTPLFPEAYSPWLAVRLPGAMIETIATCDNCAMVNPKGLTRDPGPFDGTLKCCTYFPFVPNFGLGAMLASGSENARVRLNAASQKGLLLPLGLFASPEQEARAKQLGTNAFGQKRELLCPFFDTVAMGCSVWKNRPGVCATYFCSSDRGAEGLEIWGDVETYLNQFEWTMANAVAWRMGFTEDETQFCEAVMLTEEPGAERDYLVGRAWAEWSGKREEFLIECAKHAADITHAELNELMGDELLELEESIRTRTV